MNYKFRNFSISRELKFIFMPKLGCKLQSYLLIYVFMIRFEKISQVSTAIRIPLNSCHACIYCIYISTINPGDLHFERSLAESAYFFFK